MRHNTFLKSLLASERAADIGIRPVSTALLKLGVLVSLSR